MINKKNKGEMKMSLKDFYMSKINEGIMTQDDNMIREYELALLELTRKEYDEKSKQVKTKTNMIKELVKNIAK